MIQYRQFKTLFYERSRNFGHFYVLKYFFRILSLKFNFFLIKSILERTNFQKSIFERTNVQNYANVRERSKNKVLNCRYCISNRHLKYIF
jgi:hypothetical protein